MCVDAIRRAHGPVVDRIDSIRTCILIGFLFAVVLDALSIMSVRDEIRRGCC